MDFSQLSKENYDIELSKVFAKLDKMVFRKELKKVKQEKRVFDYPYVWITCFDWLFEIWEYHIA